MNRLIIYLLFFTLFPLLIGAKTTKKSGNKEIKIKPELIETQIYYLSYNDDPIIQKNSQDFLLDNVEKSKDFLKKALFKKDIKESSLQNILNILLFSDDQKELLNNEELRSIMSIQKEKFQFISQLIQIFYMKDKSSFDLIIKAFAQSESPQEYYVGFDLIKNLKLNQFSKDLVEMLSIKLETIKLEALLSTINDLKITNIKIETINPYLGEFSAKVRSQAIQLISQSKEYEIPLQKIFKKEKSIIHKESIIIIMGNYDTATSINFILNVVKNNPSYLPITTDILKNIDLSILEYKKLIKLLYKTDLFSYKYKIIEVFNTHVETMTDNEREYIIKELKSNNNGIKDSIIVQNINILIESLESSIKYGK